MKERWIIKYGLAIMERFEKKKERKKDTTELLNWSKTKGGQYQ